MRPVATLFSRPVRRIHAVGVGGMGLGPLAVYLSESGFEVTGEDDSLTEGMQRQLERAGVTLGKLPAECDLLVYSSAIPRGHPALAAAVERQIPLIRRGDLLAEVVRGRKLVAVCGSHGKTTTTALLVNALHRAGFPAGYVLGGLFADHSPPAAAGDNEWVVAEIDESDGTIGRFAPEITVAVNLDWDHPDLYRNPHQLEEVFAALFARTHGTVLVSDACPASARTAPGAVTFGRSGRFRGALVSQGDGFLTLQLGGEFPELTVRVRAAGDFNAVNATAALAAAQLMGVAPTPDLLGEFPGVLRRQTVLSESDNLVVLEDYAHHPAEIRALLADLRERLPAGKAGSERPRLIVVFQPHRFSRTAQFKSEFAAALAAADSLHLLDVYGAGESPVAGGTTADIYAELKRQASALSVRYLPGDGAALFAALDRDARPGDLVAFVGAGDIDQTAREWLSHRPRSASPVSGVEDFVAMVGPRLSAGSRLRRDEPLASKTTLRVGGKAQIFAEPATTDDLALIWREARARGLPVHLLGRGSNLIVPDEGVEGVVIALSHPTWAAFEPREGGRVWVGAGLRLKNLCGLARSAGLSGFEFLEGIPGTVGGGLRMNAGAMGGWIFDVVEEVRLLTAAGRVETLRRDQMHVDYRTCEELGQAVALGALLCPLSPAGADTIGRQMDVYRRKRLESQPREPSAGCMFRNPPGHSAGRLIDEAGLKGTRIGGAEVSPVHANFIVNRGGATAADVLALVRRVREGVRRTSGVELQPEVLLLGRDWKEVL